MKPLEKFKLGMDVEIKELDFQLFIYIVKLRWKNIVLLFLIILFAFFVGYYCGYSNAVNYMNNLMLESSKEVTQWMI